MIGKRKTKRCVRDRRLVITNEVLLVTTMISIYKGDVWSNLPR